MIGCTERHFEPCHALVNGQPRRNQLPDNENCIASVFSITQTCDQGTLVYLPLPLIAVVLIRFFPYWILSIIEITVLPPSRNDTRSVFDAALSLLACMYTTDMTTFALQWRHNGHDGVSNHQPHECLLKCLLRRRSKKTSKLRATGLCAWNSPVTGEFPAQMASNVENVSIWWRHHVLSDWRVLSNVAQASISNHISALHYEHTLKCLTWLFLICVS